MIKECKKHGLTEFSLRKDGSYRCKKCAIESVQKRRKNVRKQAIDYKGGRCVICGYNKCYQALDFHHVNDDKEFGIGERGYTRSWKIVKEELDKCILVCSNCHREIHANVINIDETLKNLQFDFIESKKEKTFCIDCGGDISYGAIRCNKCSKLAQRKVVNRPSREELIEELKNNSQVGLGKKYGVSGNTIKKWIR